MTDEHNSDENIIRKVVNGDINIFEHIVKKYQGLVFNIGMRFFKNTDDSNDFVQDVFLKAFKNLTSYKERSPFRFWLGKVAYNQAVNSIKAKKIDPEIKEQIESDDLSPEESHIKKEVKEILLKAIEKLPEPYRVCVDLYFFHGLSYNEINEITGFPVNTIKSNVFRAKQSLRNALRGSIAEEYYEV
ncbi:MAG: sigma-70 family RNA polymerase sigma factor [Spirochaetes bacterium]|jgi:RNA polymerase sigma-70 factor (ECF subfamily)|nr:sigma-70 family RNA polymerase sigma factor [Spirochaetota bacterium]